MANEGRGALGPARGPFASALRYRSDHTEHRATVLPVWRRVACMQAFANEAAFEQAQAAEGSDALRQEHTLLAGFFCGKRHVVDVGCGDLLAFMPTWSFGGTQHLTTVKVSKDGSE